MWAGTSVHILDRAVARPLPLRVTCSSALHKDLFAPLGWAAFQKGT